ncbi:MAG: hypothetical protein AB8B56_15665 [Crocinitomicaceae bacterium]
MTSNVAGYTNIQVKTVQKAASGALDVIFDQPYDEIPVVILTPYWEGSGSHVGSIPTVTEITKTGCKIVSRNAATNYFVNVLSASSGDTKLIDAHAQAGSVQKTGPSVGFEYRPPFNTSDPVTLLTSFWNGSTGPVGNIDTLDDSGASEAKVVSGNSAVNYFTNYLTLEPGMRYGDDLRVDANIVNKTASGKLRVYFLERFDTPPTVSLSPWWDDANSGVGSIETLTKVTNEYFELVSGNAASNYFVSWVAVAER